ncbi:DUF116 domain-containing protein, partial [Candidatus Sumerlaeota bacterium]|nr:DUF116 domain-containing protein [Candidatus Sumerlaeota bacterium]
MATSTITLPKLVAPVRVRQPQENIPQTRAEREQLLLDVRRFLSDMALVPPVPMVELRRHTEAFLEIAGIDKKYLDFAAVVLSNELWREGLASIPYNRRLLLLPKCLRLESKCPAPFDEFGLLCKKCGLCSIQDLQDEAERLGYAVLSALQSMEPAGQGLRYTGARESGATLGIWSTEPYDLPQVLASASFSVALPIEPMPSEQEIEKALAECEDRVLGERLSRQLAKVRLMGSGPDCPVTVSLMLAGNT